MSKYRNDYNYPKDWADADPPEPPDIICWTCSSTMTEEHSDPSKIIYKCPNCSKAIEEVGNLESEIFILKAEIIMLKRKQA